VIDRLFVYGTLGPDRPNEHILTNIGGTWSNASLNGNLLQKGWGAEMGFPGLTLDENGAVVEGFVFTSENLVNHWHILDEFEGEAYQRVLTKVNTGDANFIEAYVYTLKL